MPWFRRRSVDPEVPPGEPGLDLAATDPGLLEQMYVNARLLGQKAYLQYCNDLIGPALETQAGAVEAWERVVAGDPGNPMAGGQLGAARNRYTVLLADVGRNADAVDQANLALDILGPLSGDDPRTVLPIIHDTLGNIILLLDETGQHGDADLARHDRALVESTLAGLG